MQLFGVRVARKLYDLQPIQKRGRYGVERICRRHEHDLAEVERQLQVIILEIVILIGVEHLQQRRRGVAVHVGGHLVYLVQKENGIVDLGVSEPADYASRQRRHVRSAVSADFRLVAHAAERHAYKLLARRARNRPHYGRFANAGRTDKAQHGRFEVVRELVNRQVFEYALFDLVKPVMVLGERLARTVERNVLCVRLVPRQIENKVYIRARHRRLGRGRVHFFQPGNFLFRLLVRRLGQIVLHAAQPLAQFFELVGVLAELLFEYAYLLAQIVFALIFVDVLAHLGGNALFERAYLRFPRHNRQNLLVLRRQRFGLQYRLLFALGRENIIGNDGHEPLAVLDGKIAQYVAGQLGVDAPIFAELLVEPALDRLQVVGVVRLVLVLAQRHLEKRRKRYVAFYLHSAPRRKNNAQRVARQALKVFYGCEHAHAINILRRGSDHRRALLRDQKHGLARFVRHVKRGLRFIAHEIAVHRLTGEHDLAAKRYHFVRFYGLGDLGVFRTVYRIVFHISTCE